MSGLYVMLGGIVLVVSIIGLMDWLNERRDRRSHPAKTR